MSLIHNLLESINNRFKLYDDINNLKQVNIKKNNDLDIYNYDYIINNNSVKKEKFTLPQEINIIEYNQYLYNELIKFINNLQLNELPIDDNVGINFKEILNNLDENIKNIITTKNKIKENINNYISEQTKNLLINKTNICTGINNNIKSIPMNNSNEELKKEMNNYNNNLEEYSIYKLFMNGGLMSKTSFLIEFRMKYSKQIEELIELSQLLYNYNNFIKIMSLSTQITIEHKYYKILKKEDIIYIENSIKRVNNNDDIISKYFKKYFRLFLEILKSILDNIKLNDNECIDVSENVFINEIYVYYEKVYNELISILNT